MCATCSAVGDAVLSELQAEVILAEAEAGLGDVSAHRPLSEAERRAQVRFSEIAALEDDYLETVTPILAGLRETVDGEILAALAGAGTAAALMDALEALTVAQPPAVREAAQEAAEGIARALEATYTASSRVAIGEAARQGVTALPAPLTATPGRFEAVAHRAALEPWRKAVTVVQTQVATPTNLAQPLLEPDLVPMVLADYDQAGAVDTARQAQHGAANAGRFDTAEQLPFESAYASEIRDENTCGPCAELDQREFSSMAEVRDAYPNGGGAAVCLGSARCRGTAVLTYRV